MQYNGSTSVGTGSITVAGGAELAVDWAGNVSNSVTSNGGTISFAVMNGGSYSGGVSLNSGATTIGLRDFFSTGTARSGTISGVISGTGSLSTAGNGTLTLTAANTYSGGTAINSGTTRVSATGSLGTGNVTVGAAILQLDNNNAIDDAALLTLDNGSLLNLNFTAGINELVQVLVINGTTFNTPIVFNSDNGYNGYSSYFTGTGGLQVVPEPATFSSAAVGAVLFGLRRRRARTA